MRTIQKLFVFTIVTALFFGCQDELAPLQDANEIQKQLKVEEVDDPVVESVTGSGHVTRDYGELGDVWRTFSMSAQKRESGLLEGTLQLNNHGVLYLEAEIVCMEFYDTQVLFVAVVTDAEDPELIGQNYTYWVQDNGQGKKSDPDVISLLYPILPYTADMICAGQPEYVDFYLTATDPFEVESGNIKVHKSK